MAWIGYQHFNSPNKIIIQIKKHIIFEYYSNERWKILIRVTKRRTKIRI